MAVELTPRAEALIQQMIESGRYEDPATIVDEAVRVLDERDRFLPLKAAIASGDEQYARGETVPFTPELVEQMKRDAEQMAREGREPNPGVCP